MQEGLNLPGATGLRVIARDMYDGMFEALVDVQGAFGPLPGRVGHGEPPFNACRRCLRSPSASTTSAPSFAMVKVQAPIGIRFVGAHGAAPGSTARTAV